MLESDSTFCAERIGAEVEVPLTTDSFGSGALFAECAAAKSTFSAVFVPVSEDGSGNFASAAPAANVKLTGRDGMAAGSAQATGANCAKRTAAAKTIEGETPYQVSAFLTLL